jgi:AcrR family transcriptional regulator
VSKRRAETREKLLAAAADVFAERGFGRATVEEICEHAGFSRGAFYSNFDSLDELFFALYSDRGAAVVVAVGAAVAAAPTGLSLDEVVERVVAALPISRESHLLNLEFAAHALRHPQAGVALADQRRALRDALLPILRVGLQHYELGTDELNDVARAVMAVQDGMFLQELLEPDDPTLPILRRRILTRVARLQ